MNLNGLIKKMLPNCYIFLFVFIYYIFNEQLVTFTSLKMGVSTVPWYCLNCTMVLSQLYHILVQLRQS